VPADNSLGGCELKLFRFGPVKQEKPGVILPDGRWVDVSGIVNDYDEAFFAADGLAKLKSSVGTRAGKCPVIDPATRIGSCVARPSKIICIGLNYSKHAAESGAELPKEPVLFLKATSSLAGPNDDVVIPRGSVKTDWEVELAVVIARRATYVSETEAMQYVAGYCVHNDYSERSFQLERAGQWCKGKGCDTFAPLGPFLATTDEIEDPHILRLWLSVNGTMRQDSNTSDMIFRIPALVSYVSQFMTLLPGDIISTGTPGGVGLGMKPPVYLKHNDVVELGIDGLGTARQRAVSFEALN
jgi:2,4-didehydro-3-deoxy-L-rhamnonate hydrolase